MSRSVTRVLLRIAIGIGLYVFLLVAQGRAVDNLCEEHPAGSRIENLEDLEGTFFLTRMGPLPDPKQPGIEKVIFCAGLTMCDKSCSLEIENGQVMRARHSSL